MPNHGTGMTPVVAVRQQTHHRPWLPQISRLTTRHACPSTSFSNFRSVSGPLTCRLVCPQSRRQNFLYELTMEDNMCAGPLTSPPTTSSRCTKPLSSTNARSTVLCPHSRPMTSFASPRQGAAWRSGAHSGFKTVTLVLRSDLIYKLNCGLFPSATSSSISSTKLDFLRLSRCSLRGWNLTGRRLIQGLRLSGSRWTLTATLLVLFEHSPLLPRVSFLVYVIYAEEPCKRLVLAMN